MDMRRIDLTVGVGYASDLSKVKAVLEGVVKTETAVIKDEPVDIFVSDLGDSAVDMGIRVWVKTEDYWPVRWRLLEQMKMHWMKMEFRFHSHRWMYRFGKNKTIPLK